MYRTIAAWLLVVTTVGSAVTSLTPLRVQAGAPDALSSPDVSHSKTTDCTTLTAAGQQDLVCRDLLFRLTFGYNTDLAVIKALRADPASAPSIKTYGIALTPDEAADFGARQAEQDMIANLRERAAGLAGFAGLYVDQAHGGQVVLLVTPSDTDAAATLLAQAQTRLSGRVVTATRTYTELEGTAAAIEGRRLVIEAGGSTITYLGIGEVENQVVVGIDPYSEVVAAALWKAFGDSVQTIARVAPEPATCSRDNCANPLKGGLTIYDSAGAMCTSNFVYRDASSNPFLVTAGHCASGSFRHNGVSIGSTASGSRQWYDYSPADAQAITIASAQKSNYVMTDTGVPPTLDFVTGRRTSDYVGMTVCTQSWRVGRSCGMISGIEITVCYGDPCSIHITHMRQATFEAYAGDSGGPVFDYWALGLEATGIMSGATSDAHINYYSPIWYVTGGRTPCLNSSCSS